MSAMPWPPHHPPEPPIPPLEIYRAAVEEYRWQADHNWRRTQYLLVLNAAVFAAAVALSGNPGRGAALIYGLGAAEAIYSVFALRTMHHYYRVARDHMKAVEVQVGLKEAERLNSTPGMGGPARSRWRPSVNDVWILLLLTLALAHIVGATGVLLTH